MEEAARVIDRKRADTRDSWASSSSPPPRSTRSGPRSIIPGDVRLVHGLRVGADQRRFASTEIHDPGRTKTRTFFFNGLDADGFDDVINPVVIEPVVQFTLYLKVKYEVEREEKRCREP